MTYSITGFYGPLETPTGVDLSRNIELPYIVPLSATQYIIMWADYGGDVSGSEVGWAGTWARLLTFSGTVTLSDPVHLFTDPVYVVPFPSGPVPCNGYVVCMFTATSSGTPTSGVYSKICTIGAVDGLPAVISDYSMWDLFPFTSGHYTDSGSRWYNLAYRAMLEPVGGNELLVLSGVRDYPGAYSYHMGKVYVAANGTLSFTDMGLTAVGRALTMTQLAEDGRVYIYTDLGNSFIADSPVGATSWTQYNVAATAGTYLAQDRQPTGYLDRTQRHTVSGNTISFEVQAWDYPYWQEFSNSQTAGIIHNDLGNPLIIGTILDDNLDETDAVLYAPLDGNQTLDLGTASSLFAGTSLGEPTGYFGYINAWHEGGLVFIVLTAGSDSAFDGATTALPHGALYLLVVASYEVMNLTGELAEQRRQFWRPRPGW